MRFDCKLYAFRKSKDIFEAVCEFTSFKEKMIPYYCETNEYRRFFFTIWRPAKLRKRFYISVRPWSVMTKVFLTFHWWESSLLRVFFGRFLFSLRPHNDVCVSATLQIANKRNKSFCGALSYSAKQINVLKVGNATGNTVFLIFPFLGNV